MSPDSFAAPPAVGFAVAVAAVVVAEAVVAVAAATKKI